jgi:flavin-dependent dehydrogenase
VTAYDVAPVRFHGGAGGTDPMPKSNSKPHYDVVILGAGLAGLTLARQTLLRCNKKILILDRSAEVPARRQKVGESTVQVGGYYLSKVLDLEEYLMREQFLKYNLRFYWKRPGAANRSYEEYDHCYIRPMSNIAGYQLNRNTLEAELLRLNTASPACDFIAPARDIDVSLSEDGPHAVRFLSGSRARQVSADWVVDTTGRGKFLAKRMELSQDNPIRHGSSFLWVDGLVNIEKLTDLSLDQQLLRKDRMKTGHFPVWLATNHYVGEGFWFWIIPLQGKTSLGIVYERNLFDEKKTDTPGKLMRWICREFPVLARDLPRRKVLDHGYFRDYSYDCVQTLSGSRWAMSGEAGRFSDPLYSPGSDLIAFHNTLILDSILTADREDLKKKVPLYETLVRSLYQAYVPSYAVSYDCLGDQEAFILKYTWELTVYFTFFVFPFVNQLFTHRDFVLPYLGKLARLGRINGNLQLFMSAFYRWKKGSEPSEHGPIAFDFTQIGPLKDSEMLFYQVGVSDSLALELLDHYFENIRQLARFIVAHAASRVLGQRECLTNRAFVESIRLNQVSFDPAAFAETWTLCSSQPEQYKWSFDAEVLDCFRLGGLQFNRARAAM